MRVHLCLQQDQVKATIIMSTMANTIDLTKTTTKINANTTNHPDHDSKKAPAIVTASSTSSPEAFHIPYLGSRLSDSVLQLASSNANKAALTSCKSRHGKSSIRSTTIVCKIYCLESNCYV